LDTVHHDGGSASGEYCVTLTATDVFSGWTELRALRNRAHRWVKEEVVDIRCQLPFPLLGVDSDNGGEFINRTLLKYCNDTDVAFTRGRPYRKNDIAVRRTVGYYRFTTDAEYQALKEVYTHLCPLLNYFYASVKLVEKIRTGPRVKKVYEVPNHRTNGCSILRLSLTRSRMSCAAEPDNFTSSNRSVSWTRPLQTYYRSNRTRTNRNSRCQVLSPLPWVRFLNEAYQSLGKISG
jgi:hypothetical protein